MELKKYSRTALYVVFGIGLAWVGIKYLLPILLPFLIGFALSRIAEPIIRSMQKWSRRPPRWLCAVVSMVAVYGILGTALFFLFRTLFRELQDFVSGLPALLASLEEPMQLLREQLEKLSGRLPGNAGIAVSGWVENLFASGSVLAERLSAWLVDFAAGLVTSLPGILLFLITSILSSFMFCSEWPALRKSLAKRLPAKWRTRVSSVLQRLKSAMGGWIKAQLKLMLLSFLVLTVGLWILGIDYPLLFGGVTAIIDALPVLGVGTVLVPWAIVQFMQQNSKLGFGLLILYGVASLTRSAAEPRLLGKQVGLSPVITLFSMYAGFKLLGVFGMILLPILAILAKQFLDLWEGRSAQIKR